MLTMLDDRWEWHHKNATASKEAVITCHGSWRSDNGLVATPSILYYYTFHGDPIYTVEIQQVLAAPKKLKLNSVVFDVEKREAVAMAGPNTSTPNYRLFCWNKATHTEILGWWEKGGRVHDLFTLAPDSETFWSGFFPESLGDFFSKIKGKNLVYEAIHYLSCRSEEGVMKKRTKPKDTQELYQQKTPYFK